MGKLLLFIMILFEVTFAVACIIKRSSHDRVKNIARIVAFMLFAILCATPIIDLSFRWYALGALLLIIALKGLYQICNGKKIEKPFKKRKIILGAVLSCIIFFLVLVPALLFPQYTTPKPTGDYAVAAADYTYIDKSRIDENGANSYVNVSFWYPENVNETFPLVVFDHGAFGVRESNHSIYLELASNGYVVCSIDHPGQSFYTKSKSGVVTYVNKSFLKEVNYGNSESCTAAEAYDLIQKWMKVRTTDMNLTIDTILSNVNKENIGLPYSLINTEKIGLFGHSMGAATSVLVGGERSDIDAVINIDGPYFSEIYYDSSADEIRALEREYDKPILNIYSDQVWRQLKDGNETGVYAANKISKEICHESFDMYLEGSKHLTLTDLTLVSPFLTYMLNGEKTTIDIEYCMKMEREAILEFFNCYLKDGPAYTKTGIFTNE